MLIYYKSFKLEHFNNGSCTNIYLNKNKKISFFLKVGLDVALRELDKFPSLSDSVDKTEGYYCMFNIIRASDLKASVQVLIHWSQV